MTSLFHTYKKQLFSSVLLFGMFFVFSLCVPQVVSAQDASLGLAEVGETVNLGTIDLRTIIARIIQVVFGVLGTILLIIILYAGWLWMTSQGEEDKIAEAKNIIKNATIGLAIMLMAFSITTFIIRLLTGATGTRVSNPSGRDVPVWEDFSGSGALGNIIADHYPFRDQRDVARNTKIIVTFKEPIEPESLIEDTNNSSLPLGTCGQPAAGAAFDWKNDCDKVKTNAVLIYRTNDPLKTPVEAAAVVSYEGDDAKTFVFRPYEYLGSDSENVAYTVELSSDITKKSGGSAFVRLAGGKYIWEFETGTVLDFTPPRVLETYPEKGGSTARNYLLQVTFDEPMDPTAVQGRWALNSNFLNIVTQPTSSVFVTGTWKISNGYKTVEFVPEESCGFNSCGDVMYCLAVDRSTCVGGVCPATPYQVLLRTATTISDTSFESIPFTGVMDVAGNALDSINANGVYNTRDRKPVSGGRTIGSDERVPDNYFWDFVVRDEIDTTAPFVHLITPSIDEEDVDERADLSITFGRRMSYTSLVDLVLEEDDGISPAGRIIYTNEEGDDQTIDPIWFTPRSSNVTTTVPGIATTTQTRFDHRVFGPNNLDLYYYTSIPSTVKSLNQNCMYPGRGPGPAGAANRCVYEEIGGVPNQEGCIGVELEVDDDTGCGFSGTGDTTVSSTDACLETLRGLSAS